MNRYLVAPAVALVLGAVSPAVASPVTVLDLNFNGTIADGAGHSFSIVGSPTIDTSTARAGSGSLRIDGGSPNYLSFNPSSDFNLGANNFTLSMSIQLSGPISQFAGGVSQWGNSSSYQLDFQGDGSSAFPRFNIVDQTNAVHGINGPGLSLGTWHDIEVQRTGNTISMFVDSVLTGTFGVSGALFAPTAPLFIGEPECASNNQCWTHGSTFWIDEIKLVEDAVAVPEPNAMLLFGAGTLWLLGRRSRRQGGTAQPA